MALSVIACSVVLFLALSFALSGRVFGKHEKTVTVNFHDVTGVRVSSEVKYAGASAGTVLGLRMLSKEERLASGDPANVVQLTLGLRSSVPELPSDVTASVAADTLLSDKFILLSGGSASAAPLANNQAIQGITPTTFDELARNLNVTVEGLNRILGGSGDGLDGAKSLLGQAGNILTEIQSLIADIRPAMADAKPIISDAKALIGETRGVVSDAKGLVGDANGLITDNREPLRKAIASLDATAERIQKLADQAGALLNRNDKNITATVSDLKVAAENLKITSVYSKMFLHSLTQRPQQLLWGGRPLNLPSQEEILNSRSGRQPAN